MFTQDLGQAFGTRHLIYCPTATPPRSWDLCCCAWGRLGADSIPGLAVRCAEAHQCEETVLPSPSSQSGLRAGSPLGGVQQGQAAEGGPDRGELVTSSMASGMAGGPGPCL